LPPTAVHFNGGVNLADAETVMREIAARVPRGVTRIPDGETGDRQQWIFFQLQKFWQTPGLEQAGTRDLVPGYEGMPKVQLADGVAADQVQWPNLGYADAYIDPGHARHPSGDPRDLRLTDAAVLRRLAG